MKYLVIVIFLMASSLSSAEDWVRVTDWNKLSWQIQSHSGRVFLRNLDAFNSEFLGCCYNYYIETSTDQGKAVWSTILSHMMTNKPLILGVADQTKSGAITYFGKW
jgi:hypothetical protein